MTKFKPAFNTLFAAGHAMLMALMLFAPAAGHAQFFQDNPDWKEGDAPPPPPYDVTRLLTFKVSGPGSLVYGVDPASITITPSDGIVRYVMVATSPSGVRNVMYEGVHCATGEVKTYARQFSGKWEMTQNPQWQTVFGGRPSPHALAFAKAGACDNTVPAASVAELVSKVKTLGQYLDY